MEETRNKQWGLRPLVRWYAKRGPFIFAGGKSIGYLFRLAFPDRFGSTSRVWVYDPGAESAGREVNR